MNWEAVWALKWIIGGVFVFIITTLGCAAWLWRAEKGVVKYEWCSPTQGVTGLWEEYSYRHAHIWRVVFQATAAVVGLSIVPYLDTATPAGFLRFIPPFVAAALAFFATSRIQRELWLFKTVKDEYLSRTRAPDRTPDSSKFNRDTLLYLRFLFVGALFHAIAVIFVLGLADS